MAIDHDFEHRHPEVWSRRAHEMFITHKRAYLPKRLECGKWIWGKRFVEVEEPYPFDIGGPVTWGISLETYAAHRLMGSTPFQMIYGKNAE